MKLLVALLVALATLLALTSCGIVGGSTDQSVTPVARLSTTPLTNEDWGTVSNDPGNYVGSKVDLEGRIFNVLDLNDGAFHFQMFTDPAARKGNTHVEWSGGDEGLREGVDIQVTGTFKEVRVTTSLAGTELRVPYVVADAVQILSPTATSTAVASPSPRSPSPTPPPTLGPLVITPTLTVTATATLPRPVITPTMTASPTPAISPTLAITPTATATLAPATVVTTPVPSTATPPSPASPTAQPQTPTAIPAPTRTPTPGPQPNLEVTLQGSPSRFAVGAAEVAGPIISGRDAASGITYLEATRSDRDWDGTGSPPVNTGSAAINVTVDESGRYAVGAHMYYLSLDANSFWLRVDDQPAVKMGNEDGGYDQWKWVGWRDGDAGNRTVIDLDQGSHTIQILGREEGTRIESIIVTGEMDYKPQ